MGRIKSAFMNMLGAALGEASAASRAASGIRPGPYVYTSHNLGQSYGLDWKTVGYKHCEGPRGGVYKLVMRVPYSRSRTYRGDPGYAPNKRLKATRKGDDKQG